MILRGAEKRRKEMRGLATTILVSATLLAAGGRVSPGCTLRRSRGCGLPRPRIAGTPKNREEHPAGWRRRVPSAGGRQLLEDRSSLEVRPASKTRHHPGLSHQSKGKLENALKTAFWVVISHIFNAPSWFPARNMPLHYLTFKMPSKH